MKAKTFSVKRENKPGIHVTGFPGDKGSAFINLKVGDSFGGEFQIIMYVPDARALAIALENAITHAEPRVVEDADLGLLDGAA